MAVKPSYGLSEDEMAQMLYDALQHGAEDMRLRAVDESRVEAKRVLHRAGRGTGMPTEIC